MIQMHLEMAKPVLKKNKLEDLYYQISRSILRILYLSCDSIKWETN